MSQLTRFFIVFVVQGLTLLIFIWAMRSGDNQMVTFTAGAALMVFLLMLIIWLMSVISQDRK